MKNEYDNEFVRNQLYEIHGAPKGITCEDFNPELDRMVVDFHKQGVEHDKFKQEYKKTHKYCPKYGGTHGMTTLMSYVLVRGKEDEYKDKNRYTCSECGDTHTVHDRVKEFNYE